MKIPNGHQAIMPYLMLVDAAKFIDFCQNVFNATLLSSRKRDDGVTIMHAEINIDGSTIMFSEARKNGNLLLQTCLYMLKMPTKLTSWLLMQEL